tara:strand:- start:161 stop:733 length:573 start_codon:yes stop_codon:yes gene_type:complete
VGVSLPRSDGDAASSSVADHGAAQLRAYWALGFAQLGLASAFDFSFASHPSSTSTSTSTSTSLSLAAQVVRQDCVASTKGGKVAGSWRDCKSGQGGRCTAAEPCTPCNDAPLFANGTAFGSTCVYPNNHRDSICHCALCTAPIEGSSGNCGFHAAAGPFCTSTGLAAAPVDLSGNALAVPCVRCCSRAKA